MNGYVAFFKNKRIEIYAKTLWDAKQEAVKQFKPSKKDSGLVSVMLAELNGTTVVHTPSE